MKDFNKYSDLVKNSKIIFLSTIGKEGFPDTRAMINLENDNLKKIYFSTNTSSQKCKQIQGNNKASAYFFDDKNFLGLTLYGEIKIFQDKETKEKFWKPGFEIYYHLGVDDPDYSVLCLEVISGKYYANFSIEEFEI
ncbi:MAG: pyridoxamine 5'-phosphate oxidase family protein [Candidatus Gracilibacteria bacterium]|nr:pyridoxamine 5'-phosphate oxidase family protein [Candidatus Gracilibacteria bacterium]MDD3120014.1 pyridoxamine 5'-phosphate oxidase family protein [Candidatus Gracilibacteria bacterium]MDD4529993.1 pyridoxamine 5'-phosphate oxidase family protein [Candidatus Gracilibacteria bacterium]